MREIRWVRLDKKRPALVLTREAALPAMRKATIAPITSTVKGLSSEVLVGTRNGLEHECVVSLDNVMTVGQDQLGDLIGYLRPQQETELARAFVLAYDLDVPLLR